MPHVVLLGDSIFDNAAYVSGGPDVVTHLRAELPETWSATLCAVDGAVVDDVERQLACIPDAATHLVISVGGNDALSHVGILEQRADSVAAVLDQLAAIGEMFGQRYRRMLTSVLARRLPVALCTIYNGALPEPGLQRRAQTALIHFNDVILRSASWAGLPVIELRLICTETADYANPIEPSVQGGRKIARAISQLLLESSFASSSSR